MIRILTFNIHYGKNTGAIAKAIKENENLKKADIILFQEVESHSIEKLPRAEVIAKELGMNFIYAPARNINRDEGTHGLATLSKFPILNVDIIPLPSFRIGRYSLDRIALNTSLDIDGTPFNLTNLHLDTTINARERLEQLKPVLEHVFKKPEEKMAIAGDFNTLPAYFIKRLIPLFIRDQRKIVDKFFVEHGFKTQVEEIDYTLRRGYIKFLLDAIYIKGARAIKYGIEKEVIVSDHLPLWVDVELS